MDLSLLPVGRGWNTRGQSYQIAREGELDTQTWRGDTRLAKHVEVENARR